MSESSPNVDLSMKSPVFPGGSLLSAVFDRDVTRLSDRGGASGLIGDRWSDVCAEFMDDWPGSTVTVGERGVNVERIVRLDAVPAIARSASRKKLQNPDYVVVGSDGSGPLAFSADAKFSVETAGASQVSAESLDALMNLGPVVTETMGPMNGVPTVVDGVFLSPDFSLTHYMMTRKRGYRSMSVDAEQVVLLPITALKFLKPIEASTLIPIFADIDGNGREARRSLTVALYYFRLARAGIGCWYDEVGSLLIPRKKPELDPFAVDARARDLATTATSGWEIIEQWDAQAESVRGQREAIKDATPLPIVNRDLREKLEHQAKQAGVEHPPSLNRVRKRIGAWFQDQLIERFGPLMPPVDNFPRILRELALASREVHQQLEPTVDRIIHEMLDDAKD